MLKAFLSKYGVSILFLVTIGPWWVKALLALPVVALVWVVLR